MAMDGLQVMLFQEQHHLESLESIRDAIAIGVSALHKEVGLAVTIDIDSDSCIL